MPCSRCTMWWISVYMHGDISTYPTMSYSG
ncbi:hypothetical protein PVAP13_1NG536919 [Panicum virgatum]|uniref:Uncharacterized protein n=1 Tax=Panicum virgatum TaxID=38727 RepID=A0A8T0X676_PANVG|nr:hypothetical protein PVAP13_1NG536919 [Panicum virgatum]